MKHDCNLIREVRVLGMMIGVELTADGAPIVKRCLERRLLVNATHGTVLRLLPALNISEDQVHEGCDILADVLKHHTTA
jgi:acetylornithine/N-succinyldiaminopimelate aminotransferase